jgi:hypothetical protein
MKKLQFSPSSPTSSQYTPSPLKRQSTQSSPASSQYTPSPSKRQRAPSSPASSQYTPSPLKRQRAPSSPASSQYTPSPLKRQSTQSSPASSQYTPSPSQRQRTPSSTESSPERIGLPTPNKSNLGKFERVFFKIFNKNTKFKAYPGGTTSYMFEHGNNMITKIARSDLKRENSVKMKELLTRELKIAKQAAKLNIGPYINTAKSGIVTLDANTPRNSVFLVLTMKKLRPLVSTNSRNINFANIQRFDYDQMYELIKKLKKHKIIYSNLHSGQFLVTPKGSYKLINFGRAKYKNKIKKGLFQ